MTFEKATGAGLRKSIGLIGLFFLYLLIQTMCLPAADAQPGPPVPADSGKGQSPYQLLHQSLQESLTVEKNQREELLDQLEKVREFKKLCEERLDAYHIQLIAYRNILVLPTIESYELQEAYSQHQVTLNRLDERVAEIEASLAGMRDRLSKTEDKLSSYADQKAEIQQEAAKAELADRIRRELGLLTAAVSDQKKALKDIAAIYVGLLERIREIKFEYESVAERFEKRIAEMKEARLLQRSVNPLSQLGIERIQIEGKRLKRKLIQFFSRDNWQNIGVTDKKGYTLFVLSFFVLLGALEAVLLFVNRFCLRLRDGFKQSGKFWQYLAVRMLRRTLFLLGIILFIYFFPVKPAYEFTPLFVALKVLADILVLVLMIRWGINFLSVLWSDAEAPLPRFLYIYLKFLVYGVLVFGIIYYLLEAGLGVNCVLLVLTRLVFETALLLWSFLFWHRFRFYAKASQLSEYPWFTYIKPLLPAAGYLIVLVGLFFELIGFGAVATFWYTSLGKTAAVILWIGVLYMAVRELALSGVSEAAEEEPEPMEEKPMPIRRLLIRLSKTALLLLFVLGVPIAWGAKGDYLADFFFAVNYQIELGEMRISFLDLAVAVLILLLTHTIVIVWKAVLKDQILAHRELDPGLKESITTISGYVGWVIGIMIVFRVIGISAASLAVLFGAVGIGIGFGLQNIFNNFVSGIILLFERPIQVGDVIEINGIWGTVTKINVRATRVKTYDNADLIIPNADFVSRQLTNWSFKDARVRRTIDIGVAYGSDTELVRETLLNIASKHSQVYPRPHPEVLFSDFGESALIFKLRIWVHINYFLSVETDIRFEINRQLQALGIQIPFPQRDIHIKGQSNAASGGNPTVPGPGLEEH